MVTLHSPVSSIGKRLREVRTQQQLSLDALAKISEVSKPMLSQIERGQSIPTIATLWKIATGLKTPLSLFLEEAETEYAVVDIEQKNVINEDHGKMRAYPLFQYDPLRNVETFYIEFDKGCHHVSDRHNDRVEETVFVISGTLRLVLNGTEVIVREKQAIRFRADVGHEYHNPYDEPCTIHNTIFYPGQTPL